MAMDELVSVICAKKITYAGDTMINYISDTDLRKWISSPFVAYDTETTGLRIEKGHKPFCHIVTYDKTKIKVPFNLSEGDHILDYGDIRTLVTKNKERVRPILEHEQLGKVAHNMKFDRLMAYSVGMKLRGPLFCTAIASHLLDENSPSNLDHVSSVVLKDLGIKKNNEDLEKWFSDNGITKNNRRYDQVPWEIMKEYASYDGLVTYLIWDRFRKILVRPFEYRGMTFPPLARLFYQEMRLNEVLCKMYLRGMKIDVATIDRLKEEFEYLGTCAEWQIYESAGFEFNINSGKQLAEVLIADGAELELTDKSKKKDAKTINYKTGENDLALIDSPIARMVVGFRYYGKIISTYLNPFKETQVRGVLRSNLNQIGTVTGRFSSDSPNMQNCPKPKKRSKFFEKDGTLKEKYRSKGRTPEDCEREVDRSKAVRRLFTPREGYTMFAIDFKQQEYRVFLDFAHEDSYIKLVNDFDADYHEMIMKEMPEFLTDRDMAKTYNFAVLYGAEGKRISEMIGVSLAMGYAMKDAFFEKFSVAREYIKGLEHRVKTVGVFVNLYGRYRRLRSSEAYKAVNSYVQGTCSDYTKEAMIRVDEYLTRIGGHLLLCIHDELIFEVPEGRESEIVTIAKIMSASNDLAVIDELGLYSYSETPLFRIALGVDASIIRENWAEKEDFDLVGGINVKEKSGGENTGCN